MYCYYGSQWFRRRDHDVLRGYDLKDYVDRYQSVVDDDDDHYHYHSDDAGGGEKRTTTHFDSRVIEDNVWRRM